MSMSCSLYSVHLAFFYHSISMLIIHIMHVHSLVSRVFHIVRVTIEKYKLKVDYTEELKRNPFQQVFEIENHVHACVSDNILYF